MPQRNSGVRPSASISGSGSLCTDHKIKPPRWQLSLICMYKKLQKKLLQPSLPSVFSIYIWRYLFFISCAGLISRVSNMQMLLKNITSEVKTHNRETTVSILFVESKKIFWVQFDCENYTSISKIKESIYDCVITGCRC